jgi:hypothetical protein
VAIPDRALNQLERFIPARPGWRGCCETSKLHPSQLVKGVFLTQHIGLSFDENEPTGMASPDVNPVLGSLASSSIDGGSAAGD